MYLFLFRLMNKYNFIFLIVIICLTSACRHANKLHNAETANLPHLNLNLKENNKIVFLTFNMLLVDSIKDTYSFSLVNKISSEGNLKKNLYEDELMIEKNYLYIKFSNGEGQESNWLKVEDPLSMLYEYPASENNDLGKTVVNKKKGELSFRFQSDSSYNLISIYKPATNNQLKKIYYAAM